MQLEERELYAKVTGINSNDGMINIACIEDEEIINIKANMEIKEQVLINSVYYFKITVHPNNVRDTFILKEFKPFNNCEMDFYLKDKIYRKFFLSSKSEVKELEDTIFNYINLIENKIIKDITMNLVTKCKEQFFIFPAAMRFHHAYVGGLAEHTCGILKIAKSFVGLYDFIDKDYLYAGAILHDLGKIEEFTGVDKTEYTIDGQLLGHLVIGSQMINQESIKLGVEKSVEARLLQHMVIAHHGQPNFGSAKKPMTAEALLLWYIDTIDSKFIVLEEELKKINVGNFTDNLMVLDRGRIYKHMENKE